MCNHLFRNALKKYEAECGVEASSFMQAWRIYLLILRAKGFEYQLHGNKKKVKLQGIIAFYGVFQ